MGPIEQLVKSSLDNVTHNTNKRQLV